MGPSSGPTSPNWPSPDPASPSALAGSASGRLPPSHLTARSPSPVSLSASPRPSGGPRTPTFAPSPSFWPSSGPSSVPRNLPNQPSSPFFDSGSSPGTPRIESDGSSRPKVRRNLSSQGSTGDQDGQDTFKQQIAIKVRAPVGSMSISPAHRDVVLAARQGLYIIDLSLPTRVPRFLPQGGLHSVADVQWSPHSTKPHSIVSTSSEKMLLWNLGLPSERGIEREVVAHRRAVTDVNWAVFSDNIVATGSLDGFVKNWDVRTAMDRDCERFSAWGFGSGATQVKWNRKKEFIIASSHDNKVLIWDTRKGSIPVTKITAHSAKIYGIDWSRENAHELVTCSFDKTIKTWSIPSLNSSVESYSALPSNAASFLPQSIQIQPPTPSVDPGLPVHWSPEDSSVDSAALNLTPSRVIQASAPVFRARNLPFGSGLLSLPQSEETSLDMWALGSPGQEKVIKTFEGHTDKVKEFVWRIRGGDDLERDDRSFQLITWGMDQSLRFWPIRESTLLDAGHKPHSPIKVIMTRKGAVDQTFIDEPDPHASSFHLNSSFSGASSTPVEANASGFGSSGFFGSIQGPQISAPASGMNVLKTVRTGTHHHHHHPRGPHHLRNALSPSPSSDGSATGTLSSHAKTIEKVKTDGERKKQRSSSTTKERKPVMTRGTTLRGIVGKTDAMVAMEWNDNVEYIHNKLTSRNSGSGGVRSTSASKSRSNRGRDSGNSSRVRSDLTDSLNWDAEEDFVRLETEFKDVLPLYNKEVKVETFDIPGRKIIFSLSGPWGPPATKDAAPTPTFIRIGLSFPPTYPKSPQRPTIDLLEMRTVIEPEIKQRVRETVRSACEISSGNCLDLVFKVLLGREVEEDERGRSRGLKSVFWEEKAQDVAEESSESDSDVEEEDEQSSAVATALTKENLRRPCGAAFGFGGFLISFTTVNASVVTNTSTRGSLSHGRSPSVTRHGEREPRLRVSTSTSNFARSTTQGRSMNDAMLLLYRSIKDPNGQKAAPRIPQTQQADTSPSGSRNNSVLLSQELARTGSRTQKPLSILQIRDVDSLFVHPRQVLAELYLLKGLPLSICRRNLAIAERHGFHSHVRGWQLLETILTPDARPKSSAAVQHFEEEQRKRNRTSMKHLNTLLIEFLADGDVQMLASMAAVLQLKQEVSSYPVPPSKRASSKTVYFAGSELLPPIEPAPRMSRLPSRVADPTSRTQSPVSNASPGPTPGRRSSYRDNSSWSVFGSGFNILGSNISIPPSFRENSFNKDAGVEDLNPSYSSLSFNIHRPSVDSNANDAPEVSTSNEMRDALGRSKEDNDSPPLLVRPYSDPTAPGLLAGARSKVLFGSGPTGTGINSHSGRPRMQSVAEIESKVQVVEAKKRPMVIKATFRVEAPTPPSPLLRGGDCLHPMALAIFHSAKEGYAEILWRWKLFQKRAELVNTYHLPLEDGTRAPLHIVTSLDVRRELVDRENAAGFPVRKEARAICDFCLKPVEGLSFPCLKCHHLTHPTCFPPNPSSTPDLLECPTGCGCRCGRPWEVDGKVALTPSAVRERLGLSGKLALPMGGTRRL